MRRLLLALLLALVAVAVGLSTAWPIVPQPQAQATRVSVPHPTLNQRVYLNGEQRKEAFASGSFPATPLSLLRIERPMRYGDWKWNEAGVPPGPVLVRVDLRTQLLSIFRGGHEIGTAVVLYGADEKETPLGHFPILWKGRNHRSSLYDAPMPYTLRLTGDGVAIHGSDVRWGAATHGCIGVPTAFAAHLFQVAAVGDQVLIVRTQEPGTRVGAPVR